MATGRPTPDADHQLAVKKLFEAVFEFAWRALERADLSGADRDDLAQSAAIAALRRWPTYREQAGTPGQWLRGIVRNELRAFRRAQAKLPALDPDEVASALAEAPDPEDRTAAAELADHLLGTLPAEQRRVVVLHDLAGLTYREIAALEGISKSEAHERHKDAMAALAAAAARLDERESRGVLPLPFSLASLHAPDAAGPSEAARAAAWKRAAPGLGEDRRTRPLWRVGAVVGAVIAGLLMARAFDGCWQRPPGVPPLASASSTPAAAPPGSLPSSTPSAEPPAEDGGPAAVQEPPPRLAVVADGGSAATEPEMVLFDTARSAMGSLKPVQALDALDTLARRYPAGQLTPSRDELRRKACALAAARGIADRRCPPR